MMAAGGESMVAEEQRRAACSYRYIREQVR